MLLLIADHTPWLKRSTDAIWIDIRCKISFGIHFFI
jgi:hypothetical protein